MATVPFPDCPSSGTKITGYAVKIEVADGCAELRPEESEWKILGAMTTKDKNISINSIESDADDTAGLVEKLVTTAGVEIPFEGEVFDKSPDIYYGYERLQQLFFLKISERKQPTLWVRMTEGDTRMSYYAVLDGDLSSSGGTNDIRTFSGTFGMSRADTFLLERVSELEVTPTTAAYRNMVTSPSA